ncbi:uncharacterized protein LOC109284405 isoform X3 [Alligator mississippiensis]|uniref:uncharacterized protein LOC109284405 isoform X3 n=1 Tax=Alligator mississippiensis TaxID=8496 RepID=UPI002877788A|nr:uncharacterized protein LOC109284405 isoform X3 [Alligator mississippiensis]XP_059574971.1 uncharacterized protein LOC109284405 isoform X3 [Alligator mississippiensis]
MFAARKHLTLNAAPSPPQISALQISPDPATEGVTHTISVQGRPSPDLLVGLFLPLEAPQGLSPTPLLCRANTMGQHQPLPPALSRCLALVPAQPPSHSSSLSCCQAKGLVLLLVLEALIIGTIVADKQPKQDWTRHRVSTGRSGAQGLPTLFPLSCEPSPVQPSPAQPNPSRGELLASLATCPCTSVPPRTTALRMCPPRCPAWPLLLLFHSGRQCSTAGPRDSSCCYQPWRPGGGFTQARTQEQRPCRVLCSDPEAFRAGLTFVLSSTCMLSLNCGQDKHLAKGANGKILSLPSNLTGSWLTILNKYSLSKRGTVRANIPPPKKEKMSKEERLPVKVNHI